MCYHFVLKVLVAYVNHDFKNNLGFQMLGQRQQNILHIQF